MTWRLRRTPPPKPRAAAAADGDGWADADWVDVGALGDLRDNRLVVEVNEASLSSCGPQARSSRSRTSARTWAAGYPTARSAAGPSAARRTATAGTW